jgi:general secretion pathway protein G
VDLTRAQVETGLSGSLDMYKKHMGQYPASLADLLTPPPTEAAEARWRGPYISRECRLRDAWGEPFKYTCPGTQNRDSFDLVSLGADGVAGTADDIGNR